MTNRTAALGRSLAAVLMVVALAVSCSSSESASGTNPEGGVDASTTTATAAPPAPSTTRPRQPCSSQTLGAAALASFEGPALLDVVCEDAAAVATLSNGPGGELVLLFELQPDGSWLLVANAPLDDPLSAVPADFSTTAVPTWQKAREARLKRGSRTPSGGNVITDVPPSSLQVNPESGETEICVQESSDYIRCSPPPQLPAPPDDPDAPPETIKQSGFCQYNYNDPRCVENPGFMP